MLPYILFHIGTNLALNKAFALVAKKMSTALNTVMMACSGKGEVL